MSVITHSNIETFRYSIYSSPKEETYDPINHIKVRTCNDTELYLYVYYRPIIMKGFRLITIDDNKYIETNILDYIPEQLPNKTYYEGYVIVEERHVQNYNRRVVEHYFKDILIWNESQTTSNFLPESGVNKSYIITVTWQKPTIYHHEEEHDGIWVAKLTYRKEPIVLPRNIEEFTLPEIYRTQSFDTHVDAYDYNYDPFNSSNNTPNSTSNYIQKLINAVYEGFEIGLVVTGEIPLWVYTNLLPLSEKGHITQNGKTYQILDINNSWYENVDNYIDLTGLDEIDFSRFDNFYVKRVIISEEYRNRSLPFKYYENGQLKNSIIDYRKIMTLDIEDDTIIMNITSTGNKPLDELVENNEIKLRIRKNISSVTKMKVIIQAMLITQDSDLVVGLYSSLNKIILEGDDVTKELLPSDLIYTIENLFCINGTLDSNNKYTPTNIYSNGELNVPCYKLEVDNYDKLININLYNVDQNNEVMESELNLIINSDITSLYDSLPLTNMKLDDRKNINYINGPVSYIEVSENTSFMNLRELPDKEEVPITKFGVIDPETGEFEQNVFTNLDVYRSDYNEELKLLDSTVRLITEPVKTYIHYPDYDDGYYSQDFTLYDQRYVNFFLFENGNTYLYLNRAMSTTFRNERGFASKTSYIIIKNWSCEINELNNIISDGLILRYYESETGNSIKEVNLKDSPRVLKKQCTNLYIVNGTIENDNLVSTENNEIIEMSSTFLGFECTNIYSTNCMIEGSKNTNFIMNGIITEDIYKSVLFSDNRTVNALPCDVDNIEIGIEGNDSTIDLTNVANSSTLLSIYNNGKKKLYISSVDILERFKDKISLPDDMFTYYDGIQEKPSTINYIKDWALELPEIKEYELTDDKKLLVTFKEQATYNCFNYLVQEEEEDSEHYLILDMSMIYTTDEEIEYLYYLFENGLYISKYNENNEIIFNLEPDSDSDSKLRVCDTNGFIKEYIFGYQNIGFDVKNLTLIYNANDDKNIITPLGNIFDNEDYINIPDAILRVYFGDDYLNYYNEHTYNTTNCNYLNATINLVVKGEIPSWLYKYLKLPIKIDRYNKIREEDLNSQIVSVNAIPVPGMRIDNINPENQCTFNLYKIKL